jgi:type I restriction enzyme M protein
LAEIWEGFDTGGREFWTGMDALVEMLDGIVVEKAGDA